MNGEIRIVKGNALNLCHTGIDDALLLKRRRPVRAIICYRSIDLYNCCQIEEYRKKNILTVYKMEVESKVYRNTPTLQV